MYYRPPAPQRSARPQYGQGPQTPSYPGGGMYAPPAQQPQITPQQRPAYSRPNQMGNSSGPSFSFGNGGGIGGGGASSYGGGGWNGIARPSGQEVPPGWMKLRNGQYGIPLYNSSIYGQSGMNSGYGQYSLPPSYMQNLPMYQPPMYQNSMYSGFSQGYNR